MAPPRKHETDAILDATRALVLAEGPRAASVAAIAKASGAPAGTLYHRFGNRDGVVTAAWLRALERFQARGDGAPTGPTRWRPRWRWRAAAVAFAREAPEDARLLLTIRPGDLRDADPDRSFTATLADDERTPDGPVEELTRALYGRADARRRDALRGRSSTCPTPWSAGTRMTIRGRAGWPPMSRRRCGRC